jgi:hypothetical protein
MSIHEVPPEQLAELIHHYHQALAPDFECSNLDRDAWERVPPQEKSRMVAAARLAILELSARDSGRDGRRYFAEPGKAEWGC